MKAQTVDKKYGSELTTAEYKDVKLQISDNKRKKESAISSISLVSMVHCNQTSMKLKLWMNRKFSGTIICQPMIQKKE